MKYDNMIDTESDTRLADLVLNITESQKKFVDDYITHFNATRAYQTVYGCSKGTANANGWKTLKKPHVKAYLDYLLEELKQTNIASAEEVLLALSEIIRDKKARNMDRLKAMELLGKFHSLYKDNASTQTTEVVIEIGEKTTE